MAAFVLIAHQGQGHDARSRGPDALQDPARDHRREGRSEDAHEASGHEQDEAGMDGGPSSNPVRERAEEHLAEAEPHEQSRDDELGVVWARRPEIAANRRQRRQHRVDRERDERHQEGDEGNELAETKSRPVRRPAHALTLPSDTVWSCRQPDRNPRAPGLGLGPGPVRGYRRHRSPNAPLEGSKSPATAGVSDATGTSRRAAGAGCRARPELRSRRRVPPRCGSRAGPR